MNLDALQFLACVRAFYSISNGSWIMSVFWNFVSFPRKRRENRRHQTTTKFKSVFIGDNFDTKHKFLSAYSQIGESKVFLVHPTHRYQKLVCFWEKNSVLDDFSFDSPICPG